MKLNTSYLKIRKWNRSKGENGMKENLKNFKWGVGLRDSTDGQRRYQTLGTPRAYSRFNGLTDLWSSELDKNSGVTPSRRVASPRLESLLVAGRGASSHRIYLFCRVIAFWVMVDIITCFVHSARGKYPTESSLRNSFPEGTRTWMYEPGIVCQLNDSLSSIPDHTYISKESSNLLPTKEREKQRE